MYLNVQNEYITKSITKNERNVVEKNTCPLVGMLAIMLACGILILQ